METKKTICDWIDENKDEVFAISDYLWEHPELSMQEYEASQKVADLLEKYGFLVNRGVAGLPTAFAAEYGSGKPVLASAPNMMLCRPYRRIRIPLSAIRLLTWRRAMAADII